MGPTPLRNYPPSSPSALAASSGDIEVLDDLEGEAAESSRRNPWLTYGPQLHRLREWGVHHKLMDLLDERALSAPEVRDFIPLLLGGDQLPHPDLDLSEFVNEVARRQRSIEQPYNPVSKRRTPWIDERLLRRIAKPGGGCIIS